MEVLQSYKNMPDTSSLMGQLKIRQNQRNQHRKVMKSEEIKQVSFDKGSRRASVIKKTSTEAE